MTFWDGAALVLTFNCVRRNLTGSQGYPDLLWL